MTRHGLTEQDGLTAGIPAVRISHRRGLRRTSTASPSDALHGGKGGSVLGPLSGQPTGTIGYKTIFAVGSALRGPTLGAFQNEADDSEEAI